MPAVTGKQCDARIRCSVNDYLRSRLLPLGDGYGAPAGVGMAASNDPHRRLNNTVQVTYTRGVIAIMQMAHQSVSYAMRSVEPEAIIRSGSVFTHTRY